LDEILTAEKPDKFLNPKKALPGLVVFTISWSSLTRQVTISNILLPSYNVNFSFKVRVDYPALKESYLADT